MQGVGRADPDLIWSADQAAAASADFTELHAAHGGLLWVAFDPQQARCGLFFWRDGEVRELTPPGYSVRSRVYEYGDGACCATDQEAAFVNEADQQIYLLTSIDVGAHGAPYALTTRPDCRYGDLSFVPAWQALLVVEESHEAAGVIHRLVRIGLDGERRVLVEGADFYAGPVASPDGRQLAWIEWDRPYQPWVATRLCLCEDEGPKRVLAGAGNDQSLQQPRFSVDGQLWVLSDRHGWWQPVRATDISAVSEGASPYDHAPAPWQLGGCTYLPLESDAMLLSRFEQGFGVLVGCAARTDAVGASANGAHGLGGPASRFERRHADSFTRFRALAADAEHYYCIAAAPDRLPAILAIARISGELAILAGGEQPLDVAHLPRPQPFDCPVGAGERCHGFFYTPVEGDEKPPPLLVFLHGGPTSACYPVLDPRIPFWTLRGYAVLDLNYRGSSGYGRAYRLRLAGEWGALEVEDVRAAVAKLADEGAIDPARVFVRGASAGGYSALCALISGGFAGGASLYGVSDPLALRQVTHKFEADYLDWLIGDPVLDAERYAARTPLLHADKITAPLIFFQGGQDAVVLPAQTESMVEALGSRGLAVEYHLYPEERHGFRQARNQAHALEQEWRFYQRLLAEAERLS